MLFNKEEEWDLELNKYKSPTFTVVSEVFKGLTGKKVIAASSSYERWVMDMSSNSRASLISTKQGWAPRFQSTSKSCLWRTPFLHVQTPEPEAHWVIQHSPSHLFSVCAYPYMMIFPSHLLVSVSEVPWPLHELWSPKSPKSQAQSIQSLRRSMRV